MLATGCCSSLIMGGHSVATTLSPGALLALMLLLLLLFATGKTLSGCIWLSEGIAVFSTTAVVSAAETGGRSQSTGCIINGASLLVVVVARQGGLEVGVWLGLERTEGRLVVVVATTVGGAASMVVVVVVEEVTIKVSIKARISKSQQAKANEKGLLSRLLVQRMIQSRSNLSCTRFFSWPRISIGKFRTKSKSRL